MPGARAPASCSRAPRRRERGADCQCLVVHDSPSTLAVTAPADLRVEESVSSAAALHHVTEETCGIHTSGVSWQVRGWARRSTRWAGSNARRTLRLAATVVKIEREDPASPRSAEARMVENVVRPRRGLVAAHTPKMRHSHRALELRHLVVQRGAHPPSQPIEPRELSPRSIASRPAHPGDHAPPDAYPP